ncbi:MAG TPA: DUF1206 domain-containing protein [Sandaracinaceae bacterium LLY-WYZ-13_1]|nr:DUF1206 domain-containing protein [Sandaracinaceae bacterium LLY-WYZ-13_1]
MRTNQRGWVEKAARAGYAAKGVVYALVGGLAVASVVTASGSVGGSRNAVQTIGQQPFGQFLLVLTGIGLLGYALWRFIQSGFDPEHEGNDKSGKVKRVGYAASGVVHVLLAVAAFQMATGGGGGGSGSQRTYIRELMMVDTIGSILTMAVGVFILGFALYEFYKAVSKSFVDELKTGKMSATTRTWVIRIARGGLVARGIVFGLIGVGVLKAGINTNPSQVQGVGGALHEIGSQPFGAILLVLVAGGLAAYGAYQVALARYRQIPSR